MSNCFTAKSWFWNLDYVFTFLKYHFRKRNSHVLLIFKKKRKNVFSNYASSWYDDGYNRLQRWMAVKNWQLRLLSVPGSHTCSLCDKPTHLSLPHNNIYFSVSSRVQLTISGRLFLLLLPATECCHCLNNCTNYYWVLNVSVTRDLFSALLSELVCKFTSALGVAFKFYERKIMQLIYTLTCTCRVKSIKHRNSKKLQKGDTNHRYIAYLSIIKCAVE